MVIPFILVRKSVPLLLFLKAEFGLTSKNQLVISTEGVKIKPVTM